MKVINHLCLVRIHKAGDTLEFNDDLLVADEVREVFLVKPMALVEHRNPCLTAIRDTLLLKLDLQRILVDGLQKPISKFSV